MRRSPSYRDDENAPITFHAKAQLLWFISISCRTRRTDPHVRRRTETHIMNLIRRLIAIEINGHWLKQPHQLPIELFGNCKQRLLHLHISSIFPLDNSKICQLRNCIWMVRVLVLITFRAYSSDCIIWIYDSIRCICVVGKPRRNTIMITDRAVCDEWAEWLWLIGQGLHRSNSEPFAIRWP